MTKIVWVDRNGAEARYTSDISTEDIGPKAGGLLGLPEAWTLPFLVVSPQISDDYRSSQGENRQKIIEEWAGLIGSGLTVLKLAAESQVILRSNASGEGLRDRGLLTSRVARVESLGSDLAALLDGLNELAPERPIGLIVQKFSSPIVRGHISNERRLRKEPRDGVIEFENVATGELTDVGIGFRKWRQGSPLTEKMLICRSEGEIRNVLHEPLRLASSEQKRVHFEWVWDGQRVYIVQADVDIEVPSGERPEDLVGQPTADLKVADLRVFRPASEQDRNTTSKLDNHLRFESAGFWQPRFYVLDDETQLLSIGKGIVSEEVRQDLEKLTGSFLVIRTSSRSGRVPLLPRSDLLSSAEEAAEWLTTDFISELQSVDMSAGQVVLICHRYVQAVASALSMGSADRQDVLIEAAWGIPEGLYYYPCDTYQVNTLTGKVEDLTEDYSRFTMRTIRKGPKRYQVFPDPETGRFTRYEVARPFDWRPTIGDQDTLNTMAAYTRQLAAELGYPINLMWFVDCRTPDGSQNAIPWYAERLVQPKISRYRQNRKDTLKVIRTEADLRALENWAAGANRNPSSGQLVIELNPTENVALRDTEFAKRVGAAAVKCDGIVILNGATLSHIYYVLDGSGATVCSLVETGIAPEREFHRKLVRDKIPEVVRSSGEAVRFGTLSTSQRRDALRTKLVEEAFEAKDASTDGLLDELADVLEVVRALAKASGYSMSDVEQKRVSKEAKRGSFDDGVMLLETSSGPSSNEASNDPQNSFVPFDSNQTIRSDIRIGSIDHGWRDVRKGSDYWEVIESAIVPLADREWTLESKGGDVPSLKAEQSRLTWRILGKRDGAKLRIKVRIQLGDRQMNLDLDDQD